MFRRKSTEIEIIEAAPVPADIVAEIIAGVRESAAMAIARRVYDAARSDRQAVRAEIRALIAGRTQSDDANAVDRRIRELYQRERGPRMDDNPPPLDAQVNAAKIKFVAERQTHAEAVERAIAPLRRREGARLLAAIAEVRAATGTLNAVDVGLFNLGAEGYGTPYPNAMAQLEEAAHLATRAQG